VAALFLASLFLAPLAQTVPPYATAPALLFVACLMATSLGAIACERRTPGAQSGRGVRLSRFQSQAAIYSLAR
jgi:hypothetical protein